MLCRWICFNQSLCIFYPSGSNRKFDKYWVSRCFMAKHWLIYNLIFTKLFRLFFVFMFFTILYFLFWFSLIIYSLWCTRHVKPSIILGKKWSLFLVYCNWRKGVDEPVVSYEEPGAAVHSSVEWDELFDHILSATRTES